MRFPITFPAGLAVDDRLRAVAARHHFEIVDADTFDATYDLLAGFFAPIGEIEPREVLRAEMSAPRWHGDVGVDFHIARIVDDEGHVVAVGDGRYAFGPDLIVGLGANFFTDPSRRGEGVAAAVDLSTRRPFLERAAARLGRSPDAPCLVAADVDPYDPDVPETLARLRLWGRCGWRVVPPAALPFALLGQADPDVPGAILGPKPNLLMVRGAESAVLTTLRRSDLAALVDALEAIAIGLAPADQARDWAAAARSAVAAWGSDEVALIPLPGREPTAEQLAALRLPS